MSIELRVEQFNALLAEHNISAFSTFERETPKLEKDERFLLVRDLEFKWYVFLDLRIVQRGIRIQNFEVRFSAV